MSAANDHDAGELSLREHAGAVTFDVRVTPRAARSAVTAVHDGALKVSLTSPPVDGAANEGLIALLSARLGVPKRAVRIVRGEHHRHKTVSVEGVSAEQARAALLGAERR